MAPGHEVRPSVTVWEADGSPWPGLGYGDEIARRLALAGCRVRTVTLAERCPDDHELDADLHVLSGGTTSATTAGGWVGGARRSLTEVLATAGSTGATVVGICFGAQLIATALAGPRAVRPAVTGMEVGLAEVRCTRTGARHRVAEFHHHEVRPEAVRDMGGATILSNEHTAVQAFSVGPRVVGYQFHPELDPPGVAATTRAHRHLIRSLGASTRAALRSVRRHHRRWDPLTFERLVLGRLVDPERPAALPPTGVRTA